MSAISSSPSQTWHSTTKCQETKPWYQLKGKHFFEKIKTASNHSLCCQEIGYKYIHSKWLFCESLWFWELHSADFFSRSDQLYILPESLYLNPGPRSTQTINLLIISCCYMMSYILFVSWVFPVSVWTHIFKTCQVLIFFISNVKISKELMWASLENQNKTR